MCHILAQRVHLFWPSCWRTLRAKSAPTLEDGTPTLLAALCAHGLVVPETSDGGTQWHRLSAADTCLLVPSGLQSHGRDLLLSAAQTICVIVDSKEVVGRRRRRRAGVHRHRPQGQRSPLWPQWAAPWPPVPHSGSVEFGTSAPSKLLSTTQNVALTSMYVNDSCATSQVQTRGAADDRGGAAGRAAAHGRLPHRRTQPVRVPPRHRPRRCARRSRLRRRRSRPRRRGPGRRPRRRTRHSAAPPNLKLQWHPSAVPPWFSSALPQHSV